MTHEEIVAAIHETLRDRMERPHLDAFGPDARLNEDLYLDSILVLHLLLNLELHYGLAAPEEAITAREISTVADLACLFENPSERAPDVAAPAATEVTVPAAEGVHGEDYVDLKIHCFVSCLCAGLKERGIDHRAFYFGVWDADFAVDERFALRYHAPSVSHAFLHAWFERLYGADVEEWYDHALPKEANVAELTRRLAARRPGGRLMVMLDLFHLPERENKFNQNPFPHYLMLEEDGDPETFMVRDPDFRWEGRLAREKVLNAIRQPTVAGGYAYDLAALRPAGDADVAAWFEACFEPRKNPLVAAVRRIVEAHLEGRGGVGLAELGEALRELPVLSIRKYAYEHGFAFFWRALKLPDAEFQSWCDEIEALALGLKAVHFQALKLGETSDRTHAGDLFRAIDRLDRLERRIKRRLSEVFRDWRAVRLPEERLRMGAA
jgi:acyl carrier protein